MLGLQCPVLTVTDYRGGVKERTQRPVVIVTARVHPGETGASWMMQGLIDYATSNVPRAVELRKRVVFKFIPMLNPDGVAVGNNRTALSGKDLNRFVNWRVPDMPCMLKASVPFCRVLLCRMWAKPTVATEPTIHASKQLIGSLGDRVKLYCDLHGHSKNHNVFMYVGLALNEAQHLPAAHTQLQVWCGGEGIPASDSFALCQDCGRKPTCTRDILLQQLLFSCECVS